MQQSRMRELVRIGTGKKGPNGEKKVVAVRRIAKHSDTFLSVPEEYQKECKARGR